jgi:hypothetical protein
MTKKQTKKPAVEQVSVRAEVAQQTAEDTKRWEAFAASLPVVTMRKVDNQWFATMPQAAAKLVTSQVAILREYNHGYPSIKVVTLAFAKSDTDNVYFTYESLIK